MQVKNILHIPGYRRPNQKKIIVSENQSFWNVKVAKETIYLANIFGQNVHATYMHLSNKQNV